jgi:hypothetical protein
VKGVLLLKKRGDAEGREFRCGNERLRGVGCIGDGLHDLITPLFSQLKMMEIVMMLC